jgi:hypothetical protein
VSARSSHQTIATRSTVTAAASSPSGREDLGAVEGELGTAGHLVMDSPYSTRRPSQPRENGDANDASGRPSPLSSSTCASAPPAPSPFAAVAVIGGAHGTVDDSPPPSGFRRPLASLISTVPASQHY